MLIPSRLPEFRFLFSRFVDDFLKAEIGAQHRQLLLQASAAAKASYDRISEKAELEFDYTDDLLRSFLPHDESEFVRVRNAWRHFAPTLMGPIQKKFEGSGWTSGADWPKVATAIFELVRTGVEEPENFAEACRTFSELPWTKGLQAAYLSPILASLRPDLYSVANTKPLKVGAWLFGEAFDHNSSIARYPAFNRDLRDGIDELAEIIDPHVPDDLDRYQTFDFFTHWMVSIERYFEQSATSPTMNNLHTILPDPDVRRELATLFAEAVIYGASLNNRNWHLSLRKKYGDDARFADPAVVEEETKPSPYRLRLVSGLYLTASLHGDGFIAWVPRESLDDEMIRTVEQEGGVLHALDFTSIPENPVSMRITPALVDWYRSVIRPLHFAYIESVSARAKKTAWRDVHRRDMINVLAAETGLDVPQPDYVYDTTDVDPRNFWWLNCNPDQWDLAQLPVGEEHFYTAYNEQGNKRRIYRHMQALNVGDLVVGYESSPRRRASAILEITKPLTPVGGNEEFHFRKVLEIDQPIDFRQMQQHDVLAEAEPIVNNQGSLFALTPDEFLAIAELGNIDPEAIEVGVAEDEKRETIRRLIDETQRDPRARESFEARERSEAQARALLEEKVGSMTEEDIRFLLDRLTLGRVDENGRDISARFGVALIGHSANQIAGDPEAFNHWIELLWKSEPEEAIEHLGTMVRQKKVKGGGISLASAILYLRDPEQFGIGLGMMTRYLRDFGYDPPTKLVTAEEYRAYLRELHRFRDEFGVDARHLDYVIWDVGAKLDGMTVEDPIDDGDAPKPSITSIAEETNIDESILTSWIDAIERKGQAILYGPPGTGKTFVARKLARYLADLADGIVQTIQFHPAYGYEDFIAGIRPVTDEETNELRYVNTPGAFVRFCDEARTKGEESRCVMIIDEINRADLARVFGELMYLLEYRDKEIRLAGGATFSIPENVRIIGTMNTADRSIALVDHALRRRFAFLELRPDYDLLIRYHNRVGSRFDPGPLVDLLKRVNEAIGDPHYAVGISYFLDRQIASVLPQIWQTEIEPYLAEHFFDRPEMVEEFRWQRVAAGIIDRPQ